MGYKAQVKELEARLDMKDTQIETLFAMLKTLVMQYGKKDGKEWTLTVPYFEPKEINGKYCIETGIENDSFVMAVRNEE